MPTAFLSSGDPIADRRFDWAIGLAEDGDHAAAAALIEQALEIAPGWAAGWFGLAAARERQGEAAAALAALDEAARLDPADRLGARLVRARLTGETPAAPPPAYVRDLFDAYADDFEAALVDRLDYRAPALISAAIEAVAPGRRFAHALDLGCGTGLMAEAIRARVDRLDGVDLSPRMAALAEAKRLYDAVLVGDVVEALAARPDGGLDLVLAADVFCYLGDLAPALAAAARALAPGGLVAFTVERAEGGDVALQESLRFAHGADHLRRLAADRDLQVERLDVADLRRDRGRPVAGLVAVFTKA